MKNKIEFIGRFNITNLKKHLNHIDSDKLMHKEFDFTTFNSTGGRKRNNYCGTSGCSFGEVPSWCKDVKFEPNIYLNRIPFTYRTLLRETSIIANFVFGINKKEFNHLFMPYSQNVKLYGGKKLSDDACKEEVNENLRIFIQKVEAGQIK